MIKNSVDELKWNLRKNNQKEGRKGETDGKQKEQTEEKKVDQNPSISIVTCK